MKLLDLVENYKGEVFFDVNTLVEDGEEDLVTFKAEEYEAIKDDILDAEVLKYMISSVVKNNIPKIIVLIKMECPDPEQEPEQEELEEEENQSQEGDGE